MQELKISSQKIKIKIYFKKGFGLSFIFIMHKEFSNGKNDGNNQYFNSNQCNQKELKKRNLKQKRYSTIFASEKGQIHRF